MPIERRPTRAGLSAVLLFYFMGVILVITLAPFHFRIPQQYKLRMDGGGFDIIANILLFFPLGFLFPLARPADREPSPIEVLGLGLLFSSFIEATQLFEPGRFSSPIDVVTNASGALLGALVVRYATRRVNINAKDVGRFSLEIPLVGLIYLLLPMLLAVSMRAATESLYLLALAPVVFVATRIVSSVQRHHFRPANFLTDAQAGVAAAVWILLATFPVLLAHPLTGVALVVAAGAVTWLQSTRGLPGTGERRFETDALIAVSPLILAHVLCVILLPLASGIHAWQLRGSFTGSRGDLDQQMLELLVPVATVTVLGYMLAEARGRRELKFSLAARRIGVECGIVALLIEIVRGFQPGAGASVAQFIVTLLAGILGAGIYHSQRQHIRWIIANRAV